MMNDENHIDSEFSIQYSAFSIQHSVFSIQHFLYVVLRHEGIAEPHFDLMFETLPGSALATWRSPCWLIERPTLLQRLADHRRVYLEFEGKLSGNRGTVARVARGECDIEIGDNEVWKIRFQPPSDAGRLVLECKGGESWEGRPTD